MRKVLKALVALAIAGSAFTAATGPAWAMPCTGGEKLIGRTGTHWKCQDRETGVIRYVLR